MKKIDLLNKIANGEEPKIKYGNFILKYNKNEKRFIDKDRLNSLYEIDFSELNDEVEVIEDIPKEDKKIQRIKKDFLNRNTYNVWSEFADKINEIIDRLNGDSDE